jgi:hypothetical protein
MLLVDQTNLIGRYRVLGNALFDHDVKTTSYAHEFGLPYLNVHLASDISTALLLQDAFDDARSELAVELLEDIEIPYEDGYYRLDALGIPQFHRGPTMEDCP